MGEPEIAITSQRHDLDEQAGAAFRLGWPGFIFHDPVTEIRDVELALLPYWNRRVYNELAAAADSAGP
jgi:hypothetical protein